MVNRAGITSPQIAEAYGRSLDTVTKQWMQDPTWPAPIGTRGRYLEFDRGQVDAWVREHRAADTTAPIHSRDPQGWLTMKEIAEESGKSYNTIRSDFSRGRLVPREGDAQEHGVKLWRRGAIASQLARRRGRRAPGK